MSRRNKDQKIANLEDRIKVLEESERARELEFCQWCGRRNIDGLKPEELKV
jgi:hypothetical protein